jgi:chlorobactene glucosyltransferase
VPDGLASLELGAGLDIWVALALGLAISVMCLRALTHYRKLPKLPWPDPFGSPAGPPDCMVVIPARNESACIEWAVTSLPPDTVIVVDDHSEDSTAEEARKAGAGVIQAPDVPRTASGKSIACMTGARALTSKWILFADADSHFSPGFLDMAVAYAESNKVALLSIYLDPEYATIVELVIAPYLTALFFCGMNPRHDLVAAFNGQCLLVRRDAYEFLGGHAVANTTPNEDIRLAAIAQRHRLKVGIVRADGLGRARWRDLGGTVRRGALRFMIARLFMGVTILVSALVMAAWIPVLAWLLLEHRYEPAAVFALTPWLLLWPWYGWGVGSIVVLTLPLAIYAALPLLWSGLWTALRGGTVEWKGRII